MSKEKLVRLFISSTFSDFAKERDTLREKVFPKIERYCEDHGGKFQAVDLRWGVSREDSLTHNTMELCMNEIEKCQELCSRPNFLIMLGDRYEWEPIPKRISMKDFSEITSILVLDPKESLENLELIYKWYRMDENSEPAEYILLERTAQYHDANIWQQEEKKLLHLLRGAAVQLGWENDQSKREFFSSATEQEIIKGIKIEDPQDHILGVIRNMVPRKTDLQSLESRADSHRINDEIKYSQSRLISIKDQIREIIPSNLIELDVYEEEPDEYLNQFCTEVESSLKLLIDNSIKEWGIEKSKHSLSLEIEKHLQFSNNQINFFTGRDYEIKHIYSYIHDDSVRPLHIIGESGTGKSALMAKATSVIKESFPDAIIVNRFVGVTSTSFTLPLLLENIVSELKSCFSFQKGSGVGLGNHKEDLTTILNNFMESLKEVSRNKKVILFIDGVNQLHSEEQAIALIKKVSRLPKNVRFIMTINSDFNNRNQRLSYGHTTLSLGDMSVEEADILLTKWLTNENRTLQLNQREYILNKFKEFSNPLFLKLIFEKVKHWMSWYDVGTYGLSIKPDSKGSIETFLEELENNHGWVMTKKSLLYLALSRYGLSEHEWVNIVLNDVDITKEFNDRSPDSSNVNSLPMHVFSRFYYEISPYLTESWNEDEKLLTFFHKVFKDSILERYIRNDRQLENTIRNRIASHFTYDPYDFRKIGELPWQILKLENWDLLIELLKNEEFLVKAWIRDEYDIYRYWAAVEENTYSKKQDVYPELLRKRKELDILFLICCANILHDTGCYNEALEFYKPVLDKCLEKNDWFFYGRIMEKACLAFEHLGVKLLTLMTYEKLEEIARINKDTIGVARLKNHQARIYRDEGNVPLALVKAKQAEEISQKSGYYSGVLTSLGIQAKIHKERGEYTKALQLNQKAENIALEQESLSNKALFLNNQAIILKETGRSQEALKMYREAEEVAREIGDYPALVAYLNNRGRIYRDENDLDAALEIYNEAEAIAKDYGLKRELGIMKMNKGVIYEELGKPDIALSIYEESQTLGMEEILSAILQNSQGRVYQKKGNFDKAMELFHNAERIARSCQSYVKLKVFIENQGLLYLEIGDSPNAQKMFRKAEKVKHFIHNTLNKVTRNDECPCGSEMKYKKCCMNRQIFVGNPDDYDLDRKLIC